MKKVWVNGCFDLLHFGHLNLLIHAAKQGDELYVGLDSDTRVRARKGVGRPIQDEQTRFLLLKTLSIVTDVYVYDTDYQLEKMIEKMKPSVMVIGEEYKDKHIIGKEFCDKITFFGTKEGYSTTELIKKIRNERIAPDNQTNY